MRIVKTRIRRKHSECWGFDPDPWRDWKIQWALKYAMKLYHHYRMTTADAAIKHAIRMVDYRIRQFEKEMDKESEKENQDRLVAMTANEDGAQFSDDDIPF